MQKTAHVSGVPARPGDDRARRLCGQSRVGDVDFERRAEETRLLRAVEVAPGTADERNRAPDPALWGEPGFAGRDEGEDGDEDVERRRARTRRRLGFRLSI